MENITKIQTQLLKMKITVTEKKNTMDGINSRLDMAEE